MYPTCHSFTPVPPRDGYDLLIGLSTGDGAPSSPLCNTSFAPCAKAVPKQQFAKLPEVLQFPGWMKACKPARPKAQRPMQWYWRPSTSS